MEEQLTKEEQILEVFATSGMSVTNKNLTEKFGVNENYLISLRHRISVGHIKLNKQQNVEQQQQNTNTA